MPTPERIVATLPLLDPEDRAHLELSFRRGFADDEIADLVGAAPDEVEGLRDEAVAELADELGEDELEVRAALEGMDEDDWAGRPRAVEEPEDEEDPAATGRAASTPAAASSTAGSGARSRRLPLLLLAGAAVLAIALIVLLASGSGDDGGSDGGGGSENTGSKKQEERKDGGAKTQPDGTPPPAGAGRPVPMERLNGTYGSGTARILGGAKLRLRVSGFLEPTGGGYAVWLIGPGDAERRLYATTDTTINRDLPLPDGYEDFEYVEIARAVPSLDSPHSSFSLLRVRVKALSTGGL